MFGIGDDEFFDLDLDLRGSKFRDDPGRDIIGEAFYEFPLSVFAEMLELSCDSAVIDGL